MLFIIMLASKHCKVSLKWVGMGRRAQFSFVNHAKKIDITKPAIKLMLEPNKNKLDLDMLKRTNQYNLTQMNKLLISNQDIVNLGEAVSLIVDGEMSLLNREGYHIVYRLVEGFLSGTQQDTAALNLHNANNLSHFLKVFTEMEKCTTAKISQIFLTFIAVYAEKCTLITSLQRETLIHFLCTRQFFTNFTIDYAKQMKLDLSADLETDEAVLMTCYRVSILDNLSKAYSNKLIREQIGSEQDRSALRQQLMAAFENPDMTQVICRLNPQLTFIPELLSDSQFRSIYSKMILRVFDPNQYFQLKFHPSFIVTVFNSLLLYYADQPAMGKLIVEKYMLSVRLYYNKLDDLIFPRHLIVVCERLGFKVPELKMMMEEHHMNLLDTYENQLFHKKSIISNRTAVLRLYYEIGVLLSLDPNPIPTELKDAYLSRIQMLFNPNVNQAYNEVLAFFTEREVSEIRNVKVQATSELSYYQVHYQFVKANSEPTNHVISQIQKQLGVTKSDQEIEDWTYPINFRNNMGARVKLLVWMLYFYARLSNSPQKIREAFSILTKNQPILNKIQKYFWYPGLFEGFSLLYLTVEPHLPESSNKSSIGLYIKTQSQIFSQIFNKVLNKPLKDTDIIQNIFYSKYVESIQPPLSRNLQTYPSEYNIQMSLHHSSQLLYTRSSPTLRQKIHNQLRSYYSRSSRTNPLKVIPFYTEYPFITDFLVSVRGKAYAIFLADEEGAGEGSEERQVGSFLPSLQYNSIEYFKKSCTIIKIENEQDVKDISMVLDKKR